MYSQSFSKEERIVSQKLTDQLFSSGKSHSLVAFPLRVVYMVLPPKQGAQSAQVLVSVPKKRLRHAVDRNRAKRQVRESYRLQKSLLLRAVAGGQRVALAFVWLADRPQPSAVVGSRMGSLLERVGRRLGTVAGGGSIKPAEGASCL